jgi:hypothetical protein
MTDHELLELAAKALGFKIEHDEVSFFESRDTGVVWDPLTRAADTLNLEIQLELTSSYSPNRGGWQIGGVVGGEFTWLAFDEDRKRASTKAAAEIGKAMK